MIIVMKKNKNKCFCLFGRLDVACYCRISENDINLFDSSPVSLVSYIIYASYSLGDLGVISNLFPKRKRKKK